VHSDAIRDIVAEAVAGKTTGDWLQRFAAEEVLASAIADFGDWLADPQAAETRAAPPVDQPGMGRVPVPTIPGTDPEGSPVAPAVGQHDPLVMPVREGVLGPGLRGPLHGETVGVHEMDSTADGARRRPSCRRYRKYAWHDPSELTMHGPTG